MRITSFRRLALSHLDVLYRCALRISGSHDQAEDLVQETYRIAFERWRTLRDPAACRAWLLRILRNLHVDELRRSRRLVPLEGEASDVPAPPSLGDPERAALARLSLERVERALARLSSDSRWLFSLREIEGLSYAEIAEVLAVPIGTVRSRLARLRARLLAALVLERGGQTHRRREEGDG